MDLVSNNLQRLICDKTPTTNQPLQNFSLPLVQFLLYTISLYGQTPVIFTIPNEAAFQFTHV